MHMGISGFAQSLVRDRYILGGWKECVEQGFVGLEVREFISVNVVRPSSRALKEVPSKDFADSR